MLLTYTHITAVLHLLLTITMRDVTIHSTSMIRISRMMTLFIGNDTHLSFSYNSHLQSPNTYILLLETSVFILRPLYQMDNRETMDNISIVFLH